MGYFDKLKSFAKTVVKSGEAVGTQVYRKSKKPFRQYMAPERAEKALEKQLKSPQRAPMNVPKINFPKEKVEGNKAAVLEMLKKSDEIVKKMEQLKVVSHDKNPVPETTHPKPQNRSTPIPQPLKPGEVPRGLLTVNNCVDLLHNYNLNKEEWTAEKLADKFHLRTTDVENLIENFRLIYPEDHV